MHRNWIGIRASAGLAIAGSLVTLVAGGFILFGTLVATSPPGPAAPPFPLAAIGIATAAMFAIFSGWGIWTAIGIFRRRGWARISIVVFALLLTLMGAGGFVAILVMPLSPPEGLTQRTMDTMRWGMAGFYGLLAALGVWWLVLFNLRSAKEYFGQDAAMEPRTRPLSVSL